MSEEYRMNYHLSSTALLCTLSLVAAAADETTKADAYLDPESQTKVLLLSNGRSKIDASRSRTIELRALIKCFETDVICGHVYEPYIDAQQIILNNQDDIVTSPYATTNACIVLSQETQRKIKEARPEKSIILMKKKKNGIVQKKKSGCSIQ